MKRISFSLVMWFLAGCASREAVVVYSPHGPDILKDYERLFEAAYPEVDVQTFDLGSQDVFNRVSAERNRPAGDVWWGAPSTMFMQAAQEDLLDPYRPTWANAVAPSDKDPNDLWYGTYRSPLAIMFNTRKYNKNTAPQTWDDLLKPEWHGKIALRKPLASGTMRTFLGAMILRAPTEDQGIAWLRKLDAATEAYLENPQLLFDHIKWHEELATVWLMPDVVLQRERNGYPFDFVLPPQTPVLTEGVAVIKGAPHPELAKRFYEFVTSPEALAHQAHAYAKVPTRTDLDPATLPDWMREQHIDAMPIDWQAFAQQETAWCARWEKEVYLAR